MKGLKEVLINPEGKFYIIASGAHYRCAMRDEDGNWVIKDNHQTFPVIKLTQLLNAKHASGAVYQVGDQFTKTGPRERPSHSQAKEDGLSGNEKEMKGKAQPPANRKIVKAFSIQAKPTGIKQHPNQTKTTHPKRQHPKGKQCPFSV